MDSLTQIVLGAAVGEVVLGKKIGNRAMVWGAVGGTIPDLDVLGGLFLSNIDNVAFHRGFSHSILFCILGAFVFGWLAYQLYQSSFHRWLAILSKSLAGVLIIAAIQFVITRFSPDTYWSLMLIIPSVVFGVFLNVKKRYFNDNWSPPQATIRNWQWLFFWALITHPLLDCFTMYGTQLFAPFSDMRVAWSTISVVDPFYTLPFLVCLITASRIDRNKKNRRLWNYWGIGISSFYLVFTVWNKHHIDTLFKNAAIRQNITIHRSISNPTILTNILWNYTGESTYYYYVAQYSMLDTKGITFSKIDKNHQLISSKNNPTMQTLKWFSDGYYTIHIMEDSWQFSDLRFGTFSGKGDGPNDFFFRFLLEKDKDGVIQLSKTLSGPPPEKKEQLFPILIRRIRGI